MRSDIDSQRPGRDLHVPDIARDDVHVALADPLAAYSERLPGPDGAQIARAALALGPAAVPQLQQRLEARLREIETQLGSGTTLADGIRDWMQQHGESAARAEALWRTARDRAPAGREMRADGDDPWAQTPLDRRRKLLGKGNAKRLDDRTETLIAYVATRTPKQFNEMLHAGTRRGRPLRGVRHAQDQLAARKGRPGKRAGGGRTRACQTGAGGVARARRRDGWAVGRWRAGCVRRATAGGSRPLPPAAWRRPPSSSTATRKRSPGNWSTSTARSLRGCASGPAIRVARLDGDAALELRRLREAWRHAQRQREATASQAAVVRANGGPDRDAQLKTLRATWQDAGSQLATLAASGQSLWRRGTHPDRWLTEQGANAGLSIGISRVLAERQRAMTAERGAVPRVRMQQLLELAATTAEAGIAM